MGHHDSSDELDSARKRAQQSRKEIETRGRFTLPEGTTVFRPLQTPGDKKRNSPPLFLEYFAHRNVGPHKKFCCCGNIPGGKGGNCWAERKAASLEKKGRTAEAAKLRDVIKMLVIQTAVFDKDLGEMVGPLVWEANEGKRADALGYKLMGIISSPKSKKWLDHKRGYNWEIKRTGQLRNTVYADPQRDDEKTEVPKEILKRLRPFADLELRKYDEEYMKACYYGTEQNKEENEEDMPKSGKKKKTRREEEASDASEEESSDSSASDSSTSDASDASESSDASDASSSDASASDSSSSDASSSDASDEKPKKGKGKKGKKAKKDASDEEASDASDASSSDDESSDASSSDSSSSDASSSDASDESSDEASDASDEDEKPKKKKKGKGRGRPAGSKNKKKKK